MTHDLIQMFIWLTAIVSALILAFVPRSHILAGVLAVGVWLFGVVALALLPNWPAGSIRDMPWRLNVLVGILWFVFGPRIMRRYIGWGGWKK